MLPFALKPFRLVCSVLLLLSFTAPLSPAQEGVEDLLNPGGGFGFAAKPKEAEAPKGVAASLVAAQTAVVPGRPLEVALKLEHPPHWHTYWLNPGFGSPTVMKWNLPEGWAAGEILWPIPLVKPTELGNAHLFEGTTWLFMTLTPPADLEPGASVKLGGKASWLLCDEGSQCMPGSADVSLELPVAAEAQPVPEVAAELAKVQAQQPQSPAAWKVALTEGEKAWTVKLEPGEGAAVDPGDVYFFDRNAAVSNQPQEVKREGGAIFITVPKPEEPVSKRPEGYVWASKGWLADGSIPALAAAASPAVAGGTEAASPASGEEPAAATAATTEGNGGEASSNGDAEPVASSGADKIGFWSALLFLFLAGVVLNIMPCVFPVLAIKVLGFVQSAGKDPVKTMKHALAYTAGLLLFVWLLAAGMFIASAAFKISIAWGDLTRYTGPLAGVVILLFLLGLNLAGVFEIGVGLTSVGGELQHKSGYAGSFWSGALTTIVSTPCSGPFMAVAMGFALKQGPVQQFILFTAFGLGIALPYVLLSCSPGLLKKLPKPGAWMETFKKALSFPMFAAALFFLNAFAEKTGTEGVRLMLWALVLVALAAWIYGTWNTPVRSKRARWASGLAALAVAAGAVELARAGTKERAPEPGEETVYRTGNLVWQRWSPERLAELRAQGRPVFVNYTTINCPTCEVNEKKVFLAPVGSDQVIRKFADLNVAALRAKYLATDSPLDQAILESLKPWGINTFPFYLMYPADPSKPPFVVSDALLSQSDVLEALQKAVE